MSIFYYQLYGINIASPLPLKPLTETGPRPAAVIIEITTAKPQQDPVKSLITITPRQGKYGYQTQLSINQNSYDLILSSQFGTSIARVDATASKVTLHVAHERTTENCLSTFLHPNFSYVACLHGRFCLHANIIDLGNDRAIALVGASGAGKSTLTLGFFLLNYPTFADDVGALTETPEHFRVHQGINAPKALKSTALQLGIRQDQMQPVYDDLFGDGYDKYFINKGPQSIQEELPLKAIFVLLPRSSKNAPEIKRLAAIDALQILAANTSGSKILDENGRRNEYRSLLSVVKKVPVFSISCPDNIDKLNESCHAILSQVDKL